MDIIHQAGIGLRHPHLSQVLAQQPDIAWLEVHSENFFGAGLATQQLDKIRQNYPLSLHGVGLSIGSADPLNQNHLRQLKQLIERYQPFLVSEHLSWGSIDGQYFNDLLPMPYTEESLAHFADKIKQVQDGLNRQLLIENPSSYLQFQASTIPEWEFYAQLPKLTGCGLLLDVNNIYVSSQNFGFDCDTYLRSIDKNDVFEVHLAGHCVNHYEQGDVYIDNHGAKVSEAVWQLFQKTLRLMGNKPTLIEWDSDIPDLSILLAEATKAQRMLDVARP